MINIFLIFSTYLFIAPKTVRPGFDLTIHGALLVTPPSPVTVTVELYDRNPSGKDDPGPPDGPFFDRPIPMPRLEPMPLPMPIGEADVVIGGPAAVTETTTTTTTTTQAPPITTMTPPIASVQEIFVDTNRKLWKFSKWHMGLDARENLSSGVCEQHRRTPACASAQPGQRLCYSLSGKYHIASSEISIF